MSRLRVPLLLVVAALIAGCGGDDEDSATTPAGGTTTELPTTPDQGDDDQTADPGEQPDGGNGSGEGSGDRSREGSSPEGPGSTDAQALDPAEVRECLEEANDPDKSPEERAKAALECAGPQAEEARKRALEVCLDAAKKAPEPDAAGEICRKQLGG